MAADHICAHCGSPRSRYITKGPCCSVARKDHAENEAEIADLKAQLRTPATSLREKVAELEKRYATSIKWRNDALEAGERIEAKHDVLLDRNAELEARCKQAEDALLAAGQMLESGGTPDQSLMGITMSEALGIIDAALEALSTEEVKP